MIILTLNTCVGYITCGLRDLRTTNLGSFGKHLSLGNQKSPWASLPPPPLSMNTHVDLPNFCTCGSKSSVDILPYVESLMSNNTEVPTEDSSTPITCTGLFSCMISWMSNRASALLAGCPAFVPPPGLSPGHTY